MTNAMSSPDQPSPSKLPTVRRWIPLAVLVVGLVLFFALGGPQYVSFKELHRHQRALHEFVGGNMLLAELGFIVAYVAMTAFSLPGGTILTVLGGYLFGAYVATVYVVVSATCGATILFLAARTSLGAVLKAKAGPFLNKMAAGFEANAMSYLLVLRLVPLFPFWLVNLVPAFLGVSLRTYVLATFFGIIPGTFVYALVGGGIGEVIETGREPDLSIIFNTNILLPLIGLALLALLPVVYKWLRGNRR